MLWGAGDAPGLQDAACAPWFVSPELEDVSGDDDGSWEGHRAA